MKNIITEKELKKLPNAEAQIVVDEYEYVVTQEGDKFSASYIRKDVYYGDSEDIVPDKSCDLSFLEGALITKIGFHKKANEGGLAIEYKKNGNSKIAVLGFTELGMWVSADVQKK
jgi:hypothetical protein